MIFDANRMFDRLARDLRISFSFLTVVVIVAFVHVIAYYCGDVVTVLKAQGDIDGRWVGIIGPS